MIDNIYSVLSFSLLDIFFANRGNNLVINLPTAQKLLETDPNNADLIKIVLDADYSIGIDVVGLYD